MKEIIIRLIVLVAAAGALAGVCVSLFKRETAAPPANESSAAAIAAPITETAAAVQASPPTDAPDRDDGETEAAKTEPPSDTSPSRTTITSRARRDYDNNSVYIDMENIPQLPELPTGCEITALTILLRHLGFDAEKTDLARNYLPIGKNYAVRDGEVYKDSFFDFFIGDPFGDGYGCFAGAIEKAAFKYLADHDGGGFTVLNISGSDPDVLYEYVAGGTPVLCWATDGMIEPEYYESWLDFETGERLDWYLNMHAFVLAGFDMQAKTVTLNDPMKGIIDYNIDRFETRYAQMYSQAIIISLDGETENE
jgi:uncharacterized protein YvpB